MLAVLLFLMNLATPGAFQSVDFSGTTTGPTPTITLACVVTAASSCIMSSTIAAGHTAVVVAMFEDGVGLTCSVAELTVTDSLSNTYPCYQAVGNAANISFQLNSYHITSALVSGTGYVSVGTGVDAIWVFNVSSGTGVDSGIGNATAPGSSTSYSMALGTTTANDNCLAVGGAATGSALTLTAGSGWTAIGSQQSSDNRYGLPEYKAVASAAVTALLTLSAANGGSFVGQCYLP